MGRGKSTTFLLDYKYDTPTIYRLYTKLTREEFKKLYGISSETYADFFGKRIHRKGSRQDYSEIDDILIRSDQNIRVMQRLIYNHGIRHFTNNHLPSCHDEIRTSVRRKNQ